MPYVLPQVQVFQEFRVLPSVVVRNLNAFVFGPHYQLFRYEEAAEKALIGLGAYDKSNDTDYSYPNLPSGSTVDQSYVKLYMENVWAQYAAISASSANPLNVVSTAELNKLRAAPVIGACVVGTNGGSPIAGVNPVSGGYLRAGVTAAEDYYMWPYGGWDGGASAWSASKLVMAVDSAAQQGRMKFLTNTGANGTFVVTGNATMPHWDIGPAGIRLQMVAGVDNDIHAPVKVTFGDGAGNELLVELDESKMATLINWAIDLQKPVKIIINLAAGTTSIVWEAVAGSKTLTVNLKPADATTLNGLKSALEGISTVATYFNITLTGSGTGVVSTAVDQVGTDISAATTTLLRDSFRIHVTPNPYVFKTANGVNHSVQFFNRDVQVGDRVRYTVTDGSSVVHTGTTKVVGFEADPALAYLGDPTPKDTNAASQAADDLSAVVASLVPAAGNARTMDNTGAGVIALDGTIQQYPVDLKNGVLSESVTITITKDGLKDVAEATVESASGNYVRTGVKIETGVGGDDGEIYVGQNMVVRFVQGGTDPDAIFQVGDVYTLDPKVKGGYTVIDNRFVVKGGAYAGPIDTTYVVEVVRGGVFNRTVNVIKGLQDPYPAVAVLSASVNWDDWLGGDVDDEYVLVCTSAGDIASAQFHLSSQLGELESGIVFGVAATDIALGDKGLMAQFDVDDTFSVGDYWIIKVNGCRPQVKIFDTAGVDTGGYFTVEAGGVLDLGGYGGTITFEANLNELGGFAPDGGLVVGDVFYVEAVAATDGAIRTLVLADDLPSEAIPGIDSATDMTNTAPDKFGSWLYLVQATTAIESERIQSPPDYNWLADAGGITVYKNLQVQDSSWTNLLGEMMWMNVYSADMYVEYRALLSTYTDTLHFIADIANVPTELGTVSPDNPLSQGVYNALSNSGNRGVWYMGVPSVDLAGFSTVLDRASLTDEVYNFAPLTRDMQILDAVEAHVNDMSSESNKRWRIAFVGTDMPTIHAVYNKADNPVNKEFYALVSDDPSVPGTQYTVVTFVPASGESSPYTNCLADVKAGDKVRINFATDAWGTASYEEYTVASVSSNTQLKLTTGLAAPVIVATKIEVWHPYSVAEMATAVAAISSGFANRRMYHVFPSRLGAFGVQETAEFGAAAIAGLCSSVAPQQGLTNIEVNGFDDLPMVYSMFNRAQLNEMAGAGTLIIMQDIAGGTIYVRHQVSTKAADEDLNTTELSITKNLDSISYFFDTRLKPYIGRFNITQALIDVIETEINDGLMYLGSLTSVGLLGPQIVLNGTSIRSIQQHPVLLDHLIAYVDVVLPYPLNVMELHLVV